MHARRFPRQHFASLALLLAALNLHAQAPSDAPPYTLKVSAQLVLLDASVTEKRTGKLIGGLAVEDFVLAEDKVPQQVSYLSTDRLPLSLSLLFDLTDTVQPVLKPLAAGANRVLTHLRPEDEVAVSTFSNHVDLLQPFTQDRKLVADAIALASERHDRNMATLIHEAVYTATEQMARATLPNSRRVEVWLTDGTSNYSIGAGTSMVSKRGIPRIVHSRQQATDLLEGSGIVASVLVERSAMTDATLVFLPLLGHYGEIDEYANLTGGPVVHTSSSQVADRLASLIDALRQRYTLGYRPSVAKPDGSVCHIELGLSPTFYRDHPGLHAKDVVVRTRKVYVREALDNTVPPKPSAAPDGASSAQQ